MYEFFQQVTEHVTVANFDTIERAENLIFLRGFLFGTNFFLYVTSMKNFQGQNNSREKKNL